MNESPWLDEIRPEKLLLNVFELGISFWFVSTVVLEENLYNFNSKVTISNGWDGHRTLTGSVLFPGCYISKVSFSWRWRASVNFENHITHHFHSYITLFKVLEQVQVNSFQFCFRHLYFTGPYSKYTLRTMLIFFRYFSLCCYCCNYCSFCLICLEFKEVQSFERIHPFPPDIYDQLKSWKNV